MRLLTVLVLVACSRLGDSQSTSSRQHHDDLALPQRDIALDTSLALALAGPLAVARRALPDGPSGGYAPAAVDCPPIRPTIRRPDALSNDEAKWLQQRRSKTVNPMAAFLSRMNIPGFDAAAYINSNARNFSNLPNIGMAMSGGGYRALLNGAGFLAAADDRTINSTGAGHLGGLLQSATYLSGLSGGGWLVGSMYANNFSSVQSLRDGSKSSSVWQLGNTIFEGPASGGVQLLSTVDYFRDIQNQVASKDAAGFPTSITDYWGRALSYQLINATEGGPAYTFSSIALQNEFVSADMPFPILVADERALNTTIVSLNSTVYEFNPFEMGSWDPTTYGFAPLRYLGSNFSAGIIPSNSSCVRGFDQFGYIMGTSSSLFNIFLLNLNVTAIPSALMGILTSILTELGESNNDIAQYAPNPFFGFNPATNRNAGQTELTLVDGGLDLQNIPLNPLIQPIRGVDVIFAVDSSADTIYNWPNGTALVATYERSLNQSVENGTAFPSIPAQNTFVNLGLNTRPTFFGCDPRNVSSPNATNIAPIVVYIPNHPFVTHANVSTFNPRYNNTQRNAIIRNGYNVATRGNGTVDAEWGVCVACVVLSRSLARTRTAVPPACERCFQRYCWDGTVNNTLPSGNFTPSYVVGELSLSSGAVGSSAAMGMASWWMVMAWMGVLGLAGWVL